MTHQLFNIFRHLNARTSMLATTSLAAMVAQAGHAQQGNTCYAPDGVTEIACAVSSSDISVLMPVEEGAEMATTTAGAGFDSVGFSLSIEEETVAGAPKPVTADRPRDRSLAQGDIQVRFDGLDVVPRLNVATTDLRGTYQAGDAVTFRNSTNYPAWIARSEVRIVDTSGRQDRVVAVLPTAPNGQVNWTMPAAGEGSYSYTFRVYDASGRYNETAPLALNRSTEAFKSPTRDGAIIAAGEGEDRTAVAGFNVYGGSVTATGAQVTPGTRIDVMGEQVIVDADGQFVMQRILPPGDHVVGVDVLRNGRSVRNVNREIEIPENEFFYVGILDVTASRQISGEVIAAPGEEERVSLDGRAAFYLKGRVRGSTLITMSADTGNGDLSDIFGRLNDKDPRDLLGRLDPDDYYLVYGDDSSAYDDTPTSGRIYVRVEQGNDYALWGDFQTDISSGEYIRSDRTLYGAKLRYQSDHLTNRGDARMAATVFAAQPESRAQRDVLRGTGGSAYFLSRQDLNGASETVQIEITDPDTGRVVRRTTLVAGQDYTIDYIQGVILLSNPLSSTSADGDLVSSGALGDNIVNLVVDYEHTPGIGDVDGATYGGRVTGWVTDDIRLGFTTLRDTTDGSDIRQHAVDAQYLFGAESYLELEVAQSDSTGFSRNESTDGGLTYNLVGGAGAGEARAYRLEGYFDLADLGSSRAGHLGFYFEEKEAGFASVGTTVAEDETLIGVYGDVALSEQIALRFGYEDLQKSGGDGRTEGTVEVAYQLNSNWLAEVGLTHTDQTNAADTSETGARTDLGLRATYTASDDFSAYVFGQATLSRSGGRLENNRVGVGVEARMSENTTAALEVSGGTSGVGAQGRITYQPTPQDQVYFGYTLDPDRTNVGGQTLVGRDRGAFVLGAKNRINDQVSTFGEHTYDLFGERRSVTRAYGVTYTPNNTWSVNGALEMGEVIDPNDENFDRFALSLGADYNGGEGVSSRIRFEYRDEDGDGDTRDRTTYLLSGAAEYQTSEDWRALATIDAVISDSDQSSIRNGEYVEASLGYAYRPVDNERLNALFKYTYLRDLPGEDQENVDGVVGGTQQRSHILSANLSYDLNESLTLGAKYGYRASEVAPRGSDDFSASTAHLAVLRADWHVVHKWDVMGEVRSLYTEESSSTDTGALLGVYRHIGNNAKLGVGYEWGQVSDDLGDLDYSNSGVFLNIVAKF